MRRAFSLCCLGLLVAISGCGSTNVDVVDLNKVLDIFASTVSELDGTKTADVSVSGEDGTQDKTAEGIEAVDVEDKDKTESFVELFRTKLNAAKLVSTPIGVKIEDSGVIRGFADKDKNNVMAAGEKSVFKIEIDPERNRVVATDEGGHYRDHRYRRSGFFGAYIYGRMLSRNRGYYTGARASAKPNYAKTTMSPKTYHSKAVAKARTAAKASARARSGSRGFSFGK